MTNPSKQTNPLDYPRYVRGIRPALASSLSSYVDDELEKIQNSVENLAVAADTNTRTQVGVETTQREDADTALASQITTLSSETSASLATIEDNLTTVTTAQSALASEVSALSSSTSSSLASIETDITALTTAQGATAAEVSSLSTTVAGNTSSITTQQESIDGLEARVSVKLDVNGYVTGWEANNDGTTGTFTVLADDFKIVSPGDPELVPFEVLDGVVYIKNAVIQSGGVDNSKLATSAVETDNVAANAVTDSASGFTSGNVSTSSAETDVQSVSLTIGAAGTCFLNVSLMVAGSTTNPSQIWAGTITLYRNTTAIQTWSVANGAGASVPFSFGLVDITGTGSVTYKVTITPYSSGMTISAQSRSLFVQNTKR